MEKHKIITSFSTILEMLKDRNEEEGIQEINETVLMFKDIPTPLFSIRVANYIIIYYTLIKTFWEDIVNFISKNSNSATVKFIIVINELHASIDAKKAMFELGIDYQIFSLKELQFNISKHSLVPKHEKINFDDISKYLNNDKSKLPIISIIDPMSRYLGLKQGDVVKITRNSPSSGEYYIFRCCY